MRRKTFIGISLLFALILSTACVSADTIRTKFMYEGHEHITKADTVISTTINHSTTALPDFETFTMSPNGGVVIVPIEASDTGLMYVDLQAHDSNNCMCIMYFTDWYAVSDTGYFELPDYDGDGSWDYADYNWMYPGDGISKGTGKMEVKKGKTYYAILASEQYCDQECSLDLRARVYKSAQNRTLKEKKSWMIASGVDADNYFSPVWFKIKPTDTGVMKVSLKEYGNEISEGDITLYNSKKKRVSSTVTYNSDSNMVYFGVKKGNTYYLKVENAYGTYAENRLFGIKYSIENAKTRSLSSKKKAKVLKRKADSTKTLFVASTGTETDWYKIKVTSKRKTQIKVNTSKMKSGNLKITVYKGSKKIGDTKTITNAKSNGKTYTIKNTSSGKLTSGTYYIKVVKSTKASGRYTIRYVK